MAVVTFLESGSSISVPEGTTLLEAARGAGVLLESPCNGAVSCGKCAVRVEKASLANVRHKGMHRLSPEEIDRGLVLSCAAEVVGDVAVVVSPREEHRTLRILESGASCHVEIAPYIGKSYDAEADLTRVSGGEEELAVELGDTRRSLYGAVVDIGTTTLAACLVDMADGREIASLGALNPQSHHAQDVLSRIRFASSSEGLQTMHAALMEEIGRLLASLAGQAGIDPCNVYEIVFSGNTTMLHLAVLENPASLGKFPYHSLLTGGEHRFAWDLGLPVAGCALVYLPPIISGYVGADITAGIAATGLHRERRVTLLVDIGTNGEMVLADKGRLFATSTAAGPAFEGMNISCGMRASNGAIERFAIGETGELQVKTIGEVEPLGICGSGLMDIAAELVACGVVQANGRLCEPQTAGIPADLSERLVKKDGRLVFNIAEKVSISQKDIRQVQLAKGAVRAGIEFLLRHAGVAAGEVERVLVAGSFGYHLRAESLLTIGLLPAEFAGKIEFVGNTSKSGGVAVLLNRAAREEMSSLVKTIEVLELANHADFDQCFVHSLGFPAIA